MEQNTQHYRGIRELIAVGVLEGNGKDIPYEVVEYLCETAADGGLTTIGKVQPLTEKERGWLG